MRYSVLALAPFVAAAYAQETETTTPTTSTTSISIPPYSNPLTAYLTQTNSYGVVTGMPVNTDVAATSQPAVETSQPPLVTIPAGLPPGPHTLYYGNESTFTISVGSSTTVVLGAVETGVSLTTGSDGVVSTTRPTGTNANNNNDNNATSTSASGSEASATSSSAANANIKVASGAMFGLGALAAFWL